MYEPLLFLEAVRLMYEHACALSDLSYSSNLALTLMSARMRGARARTRLHAYTQVAEIKKKSGWIIRT